MTDPAGIAELSFEDFVRNELEYLSKTMGRLSTAILGLENVVTEITPHLPKIESAVNDGLAQIENFYASPVARMLGLKKG